MDKNILINIQRIIIFLRFNITNEDNIKFIENVIYILDSDGNNERFVNRFKSFDVLEKNSIKLIESSQANDTEINLGYHEEYKIKEFLKFSFNQIKKSLEEEKYDMAYDLADAIHVFPDLFLQKDNKSLRRYWNMYIIPYQKKWKCKIFNEIKHIII